MIPYQIWYGKQMIASFDIGEVNFAYCIGTPNKIIVLKHFNIKEHKNQTVLTSCDAISKILLSENFDDCEKVLIEQQMPRNMRAMRIAQHVWSWFSIVIPRLNPEFVPARIKTSRGLTYKQRKQEAVDLLMKFLIDPEQCSYVQSLSKKDDVADAFVQIVSWCKKSAMKMKKH